MHLDLHNRKVLCGRSAVLAVVAPHLLDAYSAGAGEDLVQRLGNLLHSANLVERARNQSPDSQPLDVYVKAIADRAGPILPTGEPQRQEILEQVNQEVVARLSSFSCRKCVRDRSAICDGSMQDDTIVAAGGQCLSIFFDAFRSAADAASKWYTEHSTVFRDLTTPELVLSTEFRQQPHPFPVCSCIGGDTEYADTGGQLVSRIRLVFNVPQFDRQSYYAVAYVCFHECFCHAYTGASPGNQPRKPTPETDRFCEGWMDWLAYLAFKEELESGKFPTAQGADLSDHLIWGDRLRSCRQDYDSQPRRADVAIGTKAAQAFHRFLRQEFQDDIAERLFWQISVDLNLARVPPTARRQFVDFVRDHHQEGSASRKLLASIHKYLSSKDITVLVKDAAEYCRIT